MTAASGERFSLLMEQYLDGALAAAGREELQRLLHGDEVLRSAFTVALTQEHALRQMNAPVAAQAGAGAGPTGRSRPNPGRSTRLFQWSAAALMLIGTAATLWSTRSTPTLATVIATGAGIIVVHADGVREPLAIGTALRARDRIENATLGAACAFEWLGEGTRVDLERGVLTVTSDALGKRLDLVDGSLEVSAAPQPPDHPLVVTTPQALATVLGTRFTVTADRRATWVEVMQGTVRLSSATRGTGDLPVATGQAAAVRADAEPVLCRWEDLSTIDLGAWRPFSGRWQASDGGLSGEPGGDGKFRVDTAADFADFELTCELRGAHLTNAEVQLREYTWLFELPVASADPERWYRLRVVAHGDRLSAEFDGRPLTGEAPRAPLSPSGRIGIYGRSGSPAGALALRAVRVRTP